MANILGIQTINEVFVIEVDADPNSGGGTPGEPGSIAIHRPSNNVWIKKGQSDVDWRPIPTFNSGEHRYQIEVHDDFISGNVASTLGWVSTVAGTASAVSVSTPAISGSIPWAGSLLLSTGTTNTGRAALTKALNVTSLSNKNTAQEWHIYIPTLSNATDSYFLRIGWIDNATGEPVDGVYFRYNHAINGGNWQGIVAYNNVIVATLNTSAPAVEGEPIRLRIETENTFPSTNGTYNFYINDVLLGTLIAQVPAETARYTGAGASIIKNAGTTARTFFIDYYHEVITFINSR